jgi:5-formyltetrahydrofolate cyclo-ligase
MTKNELRKTYLEKRVKLNPAACAHFNLQLYNLFFSGVDLSFINVLHTYLPIARNNEPDTWPIIDRIRREFPNVRISIPRVGTEGTLENIFFEGLHQLQTNSWNIQEPKQGVPTPSEKIDLVIVPMVVCDQQGHRVGYGKGYYDRFLKTCRPDCRKIGLSFFEEVPVISDASDHDVRLNACITPERFMDFDVLP